MQYEESDSDDDGVILSKVERRRLNLLNSDRAVLPNLGQGTTSGDTYLPSVNQ